MSLPRTQIACLSHRYLHRDGLHTALQHMVPHSRVVSIFHQHLYYDALKNYDILVLPGIIGEDSPYPDFLSPRRLDHILKAVESGMTLMTFCAATYLLFEKLSYIKRNGHRKEMDGLGLVKGHADGPAYKHVTRIEFNRAAHHDLVLAEIKWPDKHRVFHLLDVNGPALHLADNNDLTQIFLHYNNVPQNPAAGFVKELGKGKIVGLAPHPEITLAHPNLPATYGHHEQDRISFLNLLSLEHLTPRSA